MLTPEEIRAMSDEAFYSRLKELGRKRKSREATREETEEHNRLSATLAQRYFDQLNRDTEFMEGALRDRDEWERFVALEEEFVEQHPNRFNECDKVRLLVDVSEAPAGAEGFVTEVARPSKKRYDKEGRLVYAYEVVVDLFDPETLRIYGRSIIYVTEEQLEPIQSYTVDKGRAERQAAAPDSETEP